MSHVDIVVNDLGGGMQRRVAMLIAGPSAIKAEFFDPQYHDEVPEVLVDPRTGREVDANLQPAHYLEVLPLYLDTSQIFATPLHDEAVCVFLGGNEVRVVSRGYDNHLNKKMLAQEDDDRRALA